VLLSQNKLYIQRTNHSNAALKGARNVSIPPLRQQRELAITLNATAAGRAFAQIRFADAFRRIALHFRSVRFSQNLSGLSPEQTAAREHRSSSICTSH